MSGRKGLNLFFMMLLCINMTSCVAIHDARTIRIEIMKPGLLYIPSNTRTVALINSVSNNLGYHPFTYT